MKKTLSLVLVLALFLTLLGSVFVTASAEGKTTVRIMIWGSAETPQQMMDEVMAQNPELAAKVNVEFYVAGQGDPECAEKIRLGLAANESVADVVRLNYTQLAEFAREGVLLSMEDIVAPVRDDMLEGYRLLTEYDGECLAVPGSIKAKLWYYRTDIFEQAGVDPTQIKTLDDFIAAGKKFQEIDPKYMMWTVGDSNPMYNYMMILSGTDASFADESGNFQLTTNPNFKKTLEAIKRLKDEGVVTSINEWTPDWEKAFADEVYVSYPNATWLAASSFLPKWGADQKGKWAVTQWPSFIGEVGGSEAGGDIYVIPNFSAQPELAKEVLKAWFLTTDGTFTAKKYGGTPPIFKSAMSDPRAQEPDPFIGESMLPETVKSIETYKLFPWDPAAQQELTIVNAYFDKAVNGQMDIDAALAAAQADLENQIGNPFDR